MEEKNTNDMDETRRKIEALKAKYGTKSPSQTSNESNEKATVKKEAEPLSKSTSVVNPKKKEDLKSDVQTTRATKKQEEAPKKVVNEKKSSKGTFILLLLIFLLIGGGVYYFFFYNNVVTEENTEQINNSSSDNEENLPENKTNADEEVNAAGSNEQINKDDFENRGIGEVSPANFSSKFFISIVALKSEEAAKEEVRRYQRLGYENPSYFFIPDHFENGAKMFKVVLGPYNSKSEAEADLPAIKVIRKDAYIDKAP